MSVTRGLFLCPNYQVWGGSCGYSCRYYVWTFYIRVWLHLTTITFYSKTWAFTILNNLPLNPNSYYCCRYCLHATLGIAEQLFLSDATLSTDVYRSGRVPIRQHIGVNKFSRKILKTIFYLLILVQSIYLFSLIRLIYWWSFKKYFMLPENGFIEFILFCNKICAHVWI